MSSVVVARGALVDFMVRCMVKAGTNEEHAKILADTLEMADYRGHYSHGLNRLSMYVRDVQSGVTAREGKPKINHQTVAVAHVDGCNLLGPVIGKFCMNLAIEKAKQVGVGIVVANNSNHFGIAGAYGLQACSQGLIGMAFTNTSPLVFPTRSKKPTVGTNPICFAAPAKDSKDDFVLDMATSAVALGKVEMQNRKDESIPEGWAVDSSGRVTTDSNKVMKEDGGLLPLGGVEDTSGYKGYGLGLMVEVMCGILSNSKYGPHIRNWKTFDESANLGQCFIAIDPQAFGEEEFPDRLGAMVNEYRSQESAEPNLPVLVAGDPERIHMKECDEKGGIPFHANQIQYCHDLAKQLAINSVQTLD